MYDELLIKRAWTIAFAITGCQLGVVVLVGYLWLIVLFFRKRSAAIAIACLLLLAFAYVGLFTALVFGWMKSGKWSIRGFMAFWTGALVLAAANIVLALTFHGMTLEEWRTRFGWLPIF
jgi:hypothetical protein